MTGRRGVGALALLLVVLACLGAASSASAASPKLVIPSSNDRPPVGYRLTAAQAKTIASRAEKVIAERPHHPRHFDPTAYTRGPGAWQVSYFDGNKEVVQVRVDDRSGAILEQWTGSQVAWTMARGYEGAFGRKFNSPWVWIPLGLLFLAPFFDPRRPFRILHLDLLVMVGFAVSHVFFNAGDIGVSVPLAYPVLLYLFGRLLWMGFRPRPRAGPLIPYVPLTWIAVALIALVGFRVALNVTDSNVIDVGYAGVIGADRIADGHHLYGPGFAPDVERGDTYGPLTYLSYVPFEQAMPWSGSWDELPAAKGTALAFDLLTLLGLILLGIRIRPGPRGRELGVALGFAWAAYPYSLFSLETNSNDSLIALCTVLAMLSVTLKPARAGRNAVVRGGAVALGAAAKFSPIVLAPLMATGRDGDRRLRTWPLFAAGLVVVLAVLFVPFIPDGGLRELYDRTVGYQASRPSPFSIWGQVDGLGWLQTAVKAAVGLLAVAVAFVPRGRRSVAQVAALGAALVIGVELTVTHWFYLYIVWFAPLALVALLAINWPGDDAEPAGPGRVIRAARADPEVRRVAVAVGALAVLVVSFLLTFWLAPWSDERITDLPLYDYYAGLFLDGQMPFRDVSFEYPPLAAPVLAAAGSIAGDEAGYRVAFAAIVFVCSAGVVLLCGELAERTGGNRTRALFAAALAPLVCGAMLRTHFDVVPVLLTLAAVALLCARRPRLGLAVLGLAVAVKLYPVVIVPVALAWLVGRGERRAAAEGALALVAVVAVAYGAAGGLSASGTVDSLRYHVERAVQVESTPAVALRALDSLGLGTATANSGHRSDGLDHPASGAVTGAFAALMLLAIAALARGVWRGAREGSEGGSASFEARDDPSLGNGNEARTAVGARAPPAARALVLASLAATVAFACLGKVLSPQYLIWIVPLAALAIAWRQWAIAALSVGALLLTLLEFPAHYHQVVDRVPWILTVVALRDLALIGVVVASVLALSARRAPAPAVAGSPWPARLRLPRSAPR